MGRSQISGSIQGVLGLNVDLIVQAKEVIALMQPPAGCGHLVVYPQAGIQHGEPRILCLQTIP